MWAGIGLRGWAIGTLGRFFRRDIQVADDQVVVRAGPYAAIRHPSYAGNLLMLVITPAQPRGDDDLPGVR